MERVARWSRWLLRAVVVGAVLGGALLGLLVWLAGSPVRQSVPAARPVWQFADRVRVEVPIAYHWCWDVAAWPASLAVDQVDRSQGTKVAKPTPGLDGWLAVGADRRYASLHGKGARGGRVVSMMELIYLLPLFVIVIFWVMFFAGGRAGRVTPGVAQGSAHWATEEELRQLRPPAEKLCVVLGLGDHKREVSLSDEDADRHTIVVGPPGTGKSAGLIAPNILRQTGSQSLVIVDPKSELVRLTYAHLSRHYEVLIVNFMNPKVTSAFNPLALCNTVLEATAFADAWISNTGRSTSEPFWENSCRTLLTAALLHLYEAFKEVPGGATLTHLDWFLNAQSPDEVFEALATSKSIEARRISKSFIEAVKKEDKTSSGIFADLLPRFLCLKDERIKASTSGHEVDLRALGSKWKLDAAGNPLKDAQGNPIPQKPIALFVALERTDAELVKPLTAVFFAQLYKAMIKIADANPEEGGKLPRRVFFLLDEFGNLGKIPDMEKYITTVRSAGMPHMLAVQTYRQILAIYDDKAGQVIIDNMGTHIALASVRGDDAERFSKAAGMQTVVTKSASLHRKGGLSLFSSEGQDTQSEHQRALIMPDEVTRMRTDQMLVVVANMCAVLVEQQRYYKVGWMQKRSQQRLADGTKVPTGGPRRATELKVMVLDEDEEMLRQTQVGSEAAKAQAAIAAEMTPEERQAALRKTFQPGWELVNVLGLSLSESEKNAGAAKGGGGAGIPFGPGVAAAAAQPGGATMNGSWGGKPGVALVLAAPEPVLAGVGAAAANGSVVVVPPSGVTVAAAEPVWRKRAANARYAWEPGEDVY